MLRITEQQAAAGWDRAGRPHTPARRPSREDSSLKGGLNDLLRDFLGRPSGGIDLDHAVPHPGPVVGVDTAPQSRADAGRVS